MDLLDGEDSDLECLMLDVRDEDEFSQFHIRTGGTICNIA